jgi:hypothetical protein
MAKVFISYSHQDEGWKNRVVRQLGVLAAEGLEVWDDRRIDGGDDWLAEIEQAIAACDVALLLISSHFLTSKFILGQEIPALLQRREQQGIRVIPVILSPCQWTRVSWVKPIQARPKDGKELSGMSEHDAESALSILVGEIDDLTMKRMETGNPKQPARPDAIDLTHLPDGAQYLFGREEELAELDAAWASAGGTRIVELVAPGGVGKTSLVKEWLQRLDGAGWRGARRVYGWSFYSQGTGDDRQASEDGFLSAALAWFEVPHDPAIHPSDKGRKLAEVVAATRSLLVLDGVEPLQQPPGPLAGELRAPGLLSLLLYLAAAGQPGLCLLTSREWLKDLDQYERNDTRPNGAVLRRDLGNLGEEDGARLLHALGAKRAGAKEIGAEDEELRAASREVHGHALTLSLLGRYLALAYAGDIRQHKQVDFAEADAEIQGGHAFKVMAAYETWFAREDEQGARQLAVLRLLGFFDRPACADSLAALRAAPAIAGLTEPLVELSSSLWRIALKRLEECGLVYPSEDGHSAPLDAHPLVREYLAKAMRERQPEAWREGHRRLYEQLKASVPHRPDNLVDLQALYQSVAHGCLAGLWQEALDAVYVERILRGTESGDFYSINILGAYSADLGALACFFAERWQRPDPALAEDAQAWLLGEVATRLQAFGRLDEAQGPMRASVNMLVKQKNWRNTAASYINLSELQLALGQVAAAVANAESAVGYADRSGDANYRILGLTALADVLYQQGKAGAAATRFAKAEAMHAKWHSELPILYSVQGFHYCELLLVGAERAAWRGTDDAASIRRCGEVAARAAQTLKWAEQHGFLLDIALGHLTLGRCALYAALLQGQQLHNAQVKLDRSVNGLRAAGNQDDIPRSLLSRAWLLHRLGNPAGARNDLNDAEQIAARGNMKLHLADIHLTRARLFHDKAELAQARALIEECGYGRRLPELEDAEAATQGW